MLKAQSKQTYYKKDFASEQDLKSFMIRQFHSFATFNSNPESNGEVTNENILWSVLFHLGQVEIKESEQTFECTATTNLSVTLNKGKVLMEYTLLAPLSYFTEIIYSTYTAQQSP